MIDKREEERLKRELDAELDQELEATFPASDALKITRTTPRVSAKRAKLERRVTGSLHRD